LRPVGHERHEFAPPEVVDAVSRKLAATQELERKNTEIEIARREKDSASSRPRELRARPRSSASV